MTIRTLFLTFRAIAVGEFEKLQDEIKGFEDDQTGSVKFILELLQKHFIEGQSPNEKNELEAVVATDLPNLDPTSLVQCFTAFSGADLDPKGELPLTMPYTTVSEAQ
jgi:hypothetical protein